MKVRLCAKAVVLFSLVGVCPSIGLEGNKAVEIVSAASFEQDIINDATKAFKKQLQNDQGVYCIARTYKLSKGRRVGVFTKTYYDGYRQKPTFVQDMKTSTNDAAIDAVVEIVYKPSDKSHMSLIKRNPRKKTRLSTKRVALPTHAQSV